MRKSGLILILPFLTLCAACSTANRKPEVQYQTVTKIEKVYPPQSVIAKCELPAELFVDTAINGDLVDAYLNWKDAAKRCAAKIFRLNQWYEEAGSSRNGSKENNGK